jgi:hypothetical protein
LTRGNYSTLIPSSSSEFTIPKTNNLSILQIALFPSTHPRGKNETRKIMNQHWWYLEQDMARRMGVHKRELAESRHAQQLMKQRLKAILKAGQHFTFHGVKVMTGLVGRKVSSTFKRSKRSL